jgi:hypothetical protein
MIPTPKGLIPWAARTEKILAKKYPPDAEPNPNLKPQWQKFSNWALICEDVLDTEPDPRFLRMCYDELRRRGLDDSIIQEMHRFAWLTAGWLNYEKMLWEWLHLDRDDVEHAVQWQFNDKLINDEERCAMIGFIKKFEGQPSAGGDDDPLRGSASPHP